MSVTVNDVELYHDRMVLELQLILPWGLLVRKQKRRVIIGKVSTEFSRNVQREIDELCNCRLMICNH